MLRRALRNVQGEYGTHFERVKPIIYKVHEHFGKQPKRERDADGEREGGNKRIGKCTIGDRFVRVAAAFCVEEQLHLGQQN